MTQLTGILDAQGEQLALDDLLAVLEAEERDESPPEPVAAVGIPASVITAGPDQDLQEDVSEAKTGTEPHVCEFEALCRQIWEEKRKPGADRPKYPYRCEWLATNVEWCSKRRRLLAK